MKCSCALVLLCSCVLTFLCSCALVFLWGQNAGSANCQEKYCHVPILKHNNAHCAWNRKGSEPSPNTSPLCKAIHKKKYNWLQKYSLSDQQVPWSPSLASFTLIPFTFSNFHFLSECHCWLHHFSILSNQFQQCVQIQQVLLPPLSNPIISQELCHKWSSWHVLAFMRKILWCAPPPPASREIFLPCYTGDQKAVPTK